MTTLTITDTCNDCGEPMNTSDAPCTPAHCQYEGIERLLVVTFTDGEDVCGTRFWASPSIDLEMVVEIALVFFEETGLDLSEWELLHIHQIGEETPEGFTTCTPPVELA